MCSMRIFLPNIDGTFLYSFYEYCTSKALILSFKHVPMVTMVWIVLIYAQFAGMADHVTHSVVPVSAARATQGSIAIRLLLLGASSRNLSNKHKVYLLILS